MLFRPIIEKVFLALIKKKNTSAPYKCRPKHPQKQLSPLLEISPKARKFMEKYDPIRVTRALTHAVGGAKERVDSSSSFPRSI
jgi:hypothetical protein